MSVVIYTYGASGQYEDVKVVDCRNAARMVRG